MTKGWTMSFAFPGFENFVALGQGNADALAKSSAASVKAIETISKAQQAVLARSLDKADAAIKSLLTVKSPAELAEWQTHLARQSFEDAIHDSRTLAEVATSSVSAVLAPFNQAFTNASKAA